MILNTIQQRNKIIETTPRLLFLDYMRALGILMVVGVHARAYTLPLPQNYYEIITFFVHSISVPIFFLADGYLFIFKNEQYKKLKYLSYIQKSFYRLMVPWFIFSCIYFLFRFLFERLDFFNDNTVSSLDLVETIKYFYMSASAPQLYFLFSLFIIRLFFPLTLKLIGFKKKFLLLTLFLYCNIFQIIQHWYKIYFPTEIGLDPILHALWGSQFYLLGIILFSFEGLIDKNSRTILLLSIVITSIAIMLFQFKINIFTQYLFLVCIYVIFFSIKDYRLKSLSSIGENSMGVYLLHAPVILKGVSIIINSMTNMPVLSYCLITFLSFIISYLISMVIQIIPYGGIVLGIYKK